MDENTKMKFQINELQQELGFAKELLKQKDEQKTL